MPILQEFMLFLKTQDDCGYIESMISCFAAPVMKGLKCGALLNIQRNGLDVRQVWRKSRGELAARLSVEFREISSSGLFLLLLVYRKDSLLEAIKSEGARRLLLELGYGESDSVEPYFRELVRRFRSGIPHEIGIFLGYPPEDVRGFMENGGANSKFSGYWKVYGDAAEASRKFEEYKRAELDSAHAQLQRAGFPIGAVQA
jgi:hypothetical protein